MSIKIDGSKTYIGAVLLCALAAYFFLSSEVSTYSDPTAGLSASIKKALGWIALMQAWTCATLRHAIYKSKI